MSLTAAPCGMLREFENLLENKHMDTNELCDQSTGDADNGAESRTMGGQATDPRDLHERCMELALQFYERANLRPWNRDAALYRFRIDPDNHRAVMDIARRILVELEPLPAPTRLEQFKQELDSKLAAMTDDEIKADFAAMGCPVETTPPAERPTPITDAATFVIPRHGANGTGSRVAVVHYQVARDLERQLDVFRDGADAMHRVAAACQCPAKDAEIAILKGQLAEARERGDRLAEALRKNGIIEGIG